MTFSKIENLPIDGLAHVPDWVHIGRLTTERAAKQSKGGSRPKKQYGLYEEETGRCIMIDDAHGIAEEIGLSPSSVRSSSKNGTLACYKYRIKEIEG